MFWAALILAVLAIFILIQNGVIDPRQFTPYKIRDAIRGYGEAAALVYVTAYALNTVILVPPIAAISLASGMIFGKIWGSLYILMGAVLGTSATFFISRTFGRRWVKKMLRGRFRHLDERLGQKGFATVLFLRLVPIIPYEVMNYVSGLSGIRFRDYFWATFLGSIPWVILLAVYGDSIGRMTSFREMISWEFLGLTLFVGLCLLIPIFYKKYRGPQGKAGPAKIHEP